MINHKLNAFKCFDTIGWVDRKDIWLVKELITDMLEVVI